MNEFDRRRDELRSVIDASGNSTAAVLAACFSPQSQHRSPEKTSSPSLAATLADAWTAELNSARSASVSAVAAGVSLELSALYRRLEAAEQETAAARAEAVRCAASLETARADAAAAVRAGIAKHGEVSALKASWLADVAASDAELTRLRAEVTRLSSALADEGAARARAEAAVARAIDALHTATRPG